MRTVWALSPTPSDVVQKPLSCNRSCRCTGRVRMVYADRTAAGEVLAGQLLTYANRPQVVVLGLPRGGVVVAAPVASRLRAPLDIVLVRKLPVPGRPELAMGAVAEVAGDLQVFSHDYVRRRAGITDATFAA